MVPLSSGLVLIFRVVIPRENKYNAVVLKYRPVWSLKCSRLNNHFRAFTLLIEVKGDLVCCPSTHDFWMFCTCLQ